VFSKYLASRPIGQGLLIKS